MKQTDAPQRKLPPAVANLLWDAGLAFRRGGTHYLHPDLRGDLAAQAVCTYARLLDRSRAARG